VQWSGATLPQRRCGHASAAVARQMPNGQCGETHVQKWGAAQWVGQRGSTSTVQQTAQRPHKDPLESRPQAQPMAAAGCRLLLRHAIGRFFCGFESEAGQIETTTP